MTTHLARTLFLTCLSVSPLLAQNTGTSGSIPTQHNEATVAQLQAAMASGALTSEQLTTEYIQRIMALDQNGPGVNAVIELNPDALAMARSADALRRRGVVLGPLHGIPVLLKDNIDTGDKMQTSAGSFALVGTPALRDSTVAANLRAGGAVILGKTNLSEWANFRSFESISGWSGRGGVGELRYCFVWYGDGWKHRLPRQRQRRCGDQAHGGAHEPRWRRAYFAYPGHRRSPRADSGRCGSRVERHPEPHV